MNKSRDYDIVLFGATGFTGRLTAEYLAGHGGERLRWALAGRNSEKLEQLRQDLTSVAGANPPAVLHADVDDEASIRALAGSTRVVISTVGPYIEYGEPLVHACADLGTDYVDLTGEPEFVDRMWLRYHDSARASGARIVHCCGFDSIPHDLGCWFTVQQLPQDVPLKVQGFVRAGGAISGGTLHSAVTAFSRLPKYISVQRQRRAEEGWPVDRRIGSVRHGLRFIDALGTWALPMPTIDPQIVRRSAAAIDRYGPDFRYGHFLQIKRIGTVAGLVAATGAVVAGSQLEMTRKRLLALRASGDGPSEAQRAKGWFKITFLGEGGGHHVRCEVSGGDPGYGETSKMLSESALCLAFDRLPRSAGVITPVQAMGNNLIERLRHRGIGFRVVDAT
ncbi:saccharopine dehydrogenase [Sinimarinibacterium sp. CAU 1509]|uniref:saccharopine dehydrogenase family protein n=1 Tax=Sinimarinibacterium sp. CAU 1509 TaxID=2562283 RepID=UPI0010ABE9DF|nr:saccharopine dehydrogenase NADP-binding domain-containing protein [Sinimarinibacterium sp. CAU 1509]TJY63130.1 saccharopine dehydrogenase [Sinimarinibacterium sp. CAU 1509]